MDTWEVIFFLAIGYFVGHFYALYKIHKILMNMAESNGIDLDSEIKQREEKLRKKVFKLEVEKIDNVLYLYERDSHDFICQASSIEELAVRAKQYKNVMLATVIHDNKVFMFQNGNAKEYMGQHES